MNYDRSGRPYWVDIQIAPSRNAQGELTHFISIQRDISDRKQTETELIEAKERAEKAERTERRFIANMSHEIRNPIHAVAGMTKLLYESGLTSRQKELVESIRYSSALLSSLVSDILDFSKIQAGKITFERKPVHLDRILKNITSMYRFSAREKPVRLQYEIRDQIPVLIGDPTRLNQILINLVGNAVKFTEEGEINVSAQLMEQTEGSCLVEFAVSDTGIGIPPGELDLVFERLVQSSTSINKGIAGSGLGLSISSQLVQLQNGKMRLESKEGVGSTFYFELPFELSIHSASLSEEPVGPAIKLADIKALNVLVAEDNPMNQKLIQLLFQKWEINFDLASNGIIALNLLNGRKRYDLALMDIQMPELDGFECAKRIRAGSGPNRDIPIIALTASWFPEDDERGKLIGFADVLTKPFEAETLYELICRFGPPRAKSSLLNLSYLQRVSKSDNSFIKDMLEVFLSMTPEALVQMQKGVETQDAQALYRIAHKMRSTYRIIGNAELIRLVTEVDKESATEKPDWESLSHKVKRIIEISEAAIPEVEAAVANQ